MNDLDFIKGFGKIKISDCCKKYNVNYSNVYYGKTTKEKMKGIREEIEDKIARLYLKRNDENVNKTDTL